MSLNPKSEFQNSKQIRKPNVQMTKTKGSYSNFEIRISDLETLYLAFY
jgi:hypothetical protein